jgi:cobalamin biosynthesis protein CobT
MAKGMRRIERKFAVGCDPRFAIMDVEQLGGTMVDQLAELFEEE